MVFFSLDYFLFGVGCCILSLTWNFSFFYFTDCWATILLPYDMGSGGGGLRTHGLTNAAFVHLLNKLQSSVVGRAP